MSDSEWLRGNLAEARGRHTAMAPVRAAIASTRKTLCSAPVNFREICWQSRWELLDYATCLNNLHFLIFAQLQTSSSPLRPQSSMPSWLSSLAGNKISLFATEFSLRAQLPAEYPMKQDIYLYIHTPINTHRYTQI